MLTKGATTEVSFLASLATESRRPVLVAAMLHNPIERGRVFEQVEAMKAATQAGAAVVPQVSPCPLTMEFTLESAYPFEGLAAWHPAMEAKGAQAWKPAKRERKVSTALRAYAAFTTSAARGAVRDVDQPRR